MEIVKNYSVCHSCKEKCKIDYRIILQDDGTYALQHCSYFGEWYTMSTAARLKTLERRILLRGTPVERKLPEY